MARRLIKKRSHKTGLPPGSLVHVGERKAERVKISILDYDEAQLEEKEAKTIEESFPFKEKPTVTWINIDGLHEVEIIEKLGSHFGLHPLLLEDILNTDQRPKMEDAGAYIFVVLKMLYPGENKDRVEAEQVSLILGSNFVITLQEREGDVFNPVRDRIRRNKGRIRKAGADYLAYVLLDAIVDNYFLILENVGEKIEDTEQQLATNPAPETLQYIRELKNEMIFLRKSIWPLRELINGLERSESTLIHESTGAYLRDVYDHTIQIIDTVESYRDMISGMVDIYLSSISNKMNEVMKVLTIFASIFIPLTFVAGIYGMNFEFMPELTWRWGYFILLAVMALIGILLVVYFKRKRWL
ncbi:MAG: magnesium/cobalt transporter CorA [Chloroflexi bacterium]|nr:magnesium/cobalt transporter CorA [Chloroflexota bacterium]MBI3931229.1 magnesium/cobalt transporter CorA [Chloroflexota bacterium]